MNKFYIVNDSNEFGYVCPLDNKESKDRYIMFSAHKKQADIFEDENSLDGITNLHEYIINGKVQKRYVDLDKDNKIIYEDLALYIVMGLARYCNDNEIRYYYKEIGISSDHELNINDIELSKCTCNLDNVERLYHYTLCNNPKILKYHHNKDNTFTWINNENELPLEKDIILDLIDTISENVKIDNIENFNLLRNELINIMKIKWEMK